MSETLAEATGLIDKIADKLGMAAEHVYEVIVQAQPYLATVSIVSTVGGAAAGGGLVYYVHSNADEWAKDIAPPKEFVYLIGAAMSIPAGLIVADLLSSVGQNIVAIINPEFAAIAKLAEAVTGTSLW